MHGTRNPRLKKNYFEIFVHFVVYYVREDKENKSFLASQNLYRETSLFGVGIEELHDLLQWFTKWAICPRPQGATPIF